MTNGILSACADWTGDRPVACPWRALADPFVLRVQRAYRFFEDGNLAVMLPNPPHRIVEGVSHFHGALNRISAAQWEQDRKERERQRPQGSR